MRLGSVGECRITAERRRRQGRSHRRSDLSSSLACYARRSPLDLACAIYGVPNTVGAVRNWLQNAKELRHNSDSVAMRTAGQFTLHPNVSASSEGKIAIDLQE